MISVPVGRRNEVIAAVLLLLAVSWAFFPAVNNGFVNYDDPDYVTANSNVQRALDWQGVRWAFCESRTSSNWHPVTMLSHMLDCQWFALDPRGHHLTSIVLHAADTLLLFFLLRRMTGATWRSFFVAALFGLHPLRVESVAWIAERKDVLSTFFLLLTLLAYERFASNAGKSRWPWYALALLLFAIGLMAKPMLVTLPCMLLLLDFWPLRRTEKVRLPALLIEKLPFLALSAASSVTTFIVQRHGGAMGMAGDMTLLQRIGNAAVAYCRYLGKTFWPENLAVFYPFPAQNWPLNTVLLAVMLIVGITALTVRLGKRHPYSAVGWMWFLGTLVPVIGIVQVGQQSIADRYTYIPSIGLFVAIVWALAGARAYFRVPVAVVAAVASIVLAWCIAGTRAQIAHWKDGEALFRRALEVTGGNSMSHLSLGIALIDKGHFSEAADECRRALGFQSLNPHGDALAHGNLGSALMGLGHTDEAVQEYEAALRIEPGLGFAVFNLGRAYIVNGRFDDAAKLYGDAIRMNPENGRAHFFLACVLSEKKQAIDALAHFREAARIEPDAVDAQRQFAQALGEIGEIGQAILQWEKVLRLAPADISVRNGLGICLAQNARYDEAIAQFREALRLNPGDEDSKANLEIALSQKSATQKP